MAIDLELLQSQVGQEAPVGDWVTVTQAMIDEFATLTGDRQWIHVDVERAKRESPFKSTIAHGLLVLSLIPGLIADRAPWARARIGVNYGADRLRFIRPVPAGTRIRARQSLKSAEAFAGGGVKVVTAVLVEAEGQDKPVCSVDMIGILMA